MIRRLLLVVGSFLLTFSFVEGFARLRFPEWAPRTALITKFWQHDPRYGWSHVPAITGPFRSFGIDTVVRINRKGFRGPEISYARNGASKRIVVLGDSLVWGFGVDFEAMFTSQLERFLSDTEVINLGVSGYSTDQELLLYQDEGYKYQADIVVLVVALNDRAANERTVEYLIYGKPRFVMSNGRLVLINQPVEETSWLKRVAVWLTWRSFVLSQFHRYLYQLGSERVVPADEGRAAKTTVISDSSSTKFQVPRSFARWDLTLRLLLELKQVTEENGAELLVVFADGIGIPVAREMAAFLDTLRINNIFLDEYLDRNDKSLYLPDMVHWSGTGNEIVGAVLAEKLRQKLNGSQ